jgi:hypothetical protein
MNTGTCMTESVIAKYTSGTADEEQLNTLIADAADQAGQIVGIACLPAALVRR